MLWFLSCTCTSVMLKLSIAPNWLQFHQTTEWFPNQWFFSTAVLRKHFHSFPSLVGITKSLKKLSKSSVSKSRSKNFLTISSLLQQHTHFQIEISLSSKIRKIHLFSRKSQINNNESEMKIIVDTKSETPSYTCMYNLNIATGTCNLWIRRREL